MVSHPVSSPDLTVRLTPHLTLKHPVLAAAGTYGWGDELTDLADPSTLAALITPTLTLKLRNGNPMPRHAEASAGLLHATGLPNPGLQEFLADRLPLLQAMHCPVIISLLGESDAEWAEMAMAFEQAGGVAALELNLTPLPLLAADHADDALPSEQELHARIAGAIRAVRAVTSLPVFAKLPSSGVEIGVAAKTAEAAGADVISVSHSFPGVAVRLSARSLRFSGMAAGLSGPCIKPLALYQVWRVRQCVAIPVLGMGGILTTEDALEFFIAGAAAVAVGVASTIHPRVIEKIRSEIEGYLQQHTMASLDALS